MTNRREFLVSSATLLASAGFATPSAAQTLGKPARILVGFPPGGTADLMGRLLAQRLRGAYAPSVVVENRPGALQAVIVQALLSFIAPYSPLAPVLDALTRRFYQPFRRFIPPMGNIDLSPLFLILAAQIVIIILERLRFAVTTPF